MGKEVKKIYANVVAANNGITEKNVRSLFIWYDLFSYALSFQLIFLFAYSNNIGYSLTMLSALFILIINSKLKNFLEKDAKSYKKFAKKMSLIKLCTIPLLIVGVSSTIGIVMVTFGLI